MASQTAKAGDICIGGTAISRANPSAVFSLLKDSAGWPRWSMFTSSGLERAGHSDPEGLGAIKTFSTHVTKTREQVTELIPDRKLGYVLLSGFPFRNYHGNVVLTSTGAGTRIDWTATFQCRYGTGWFWRRLMNRVLSDLSKQLAAAADAATTSD